MTVIESVIATSTAEFRANQRAFDRLVDQLHERRRAARAGADRKARDRHEAARKLLPRDRVEALLDPGSPFLEIAELAGDGIYEGVPPGAAMITGIGQISGRTCMIIANDSPVKGGTYYGLTARKHVRAQQIAWQHRLPNITLVDSGGANLPEQASIFPDAGQYTGVFYQIIRQSADGIPQIASVHGACTAGGAYVPALCDTAVIVRGQGYMFLGGPELTYAATGERIDRENLGGAEMHSRISGVTDYLADNDWHALAQVREIVRDLPARAPRLRPIEPSLPPRYDPWEINGIVSSDPRLPTDTREILARLLDDSRFDEFKALYGDTLLCGWGHIHGNAVGVLANRGVLFGDSSVKGAHFIEMCCQRDIPLVFLSDVTGFMVGRQSEEQGIAKHGAKLMTAIASANVPRYHVIIGAAYGAGYMGMSSRPFHPHFSFGWPNGRAALMGPEQAAMTLAMVQRQKREREGQVWSEAEEQAFKEPIRRQFETFANMHNYAANLWIDNIITPAETREVLALALDLSARVPVTAPRFGIFRM